jgi:hypothetical protein
MSSYWDRTDERRRRIAEKAEALADWQLANWGWSDQRPRDGVGNVIKLKPGQRQKTPVKARERA